MRFPIAYYLLLIYLTMMARPFLPLLSDVWSHTFSETIHIAKVHARYGANHLEKELAAAEKENNNASKNTAGVKTTEPVPVHLPGEILTCLFLQKQHNFYHSPKNESGLLPGFIKALAHPPSPNC